MRTNIITLTLLCATFALNAQMNVPQAVQNGTNYSQIKHQIEDYLKINSSTGEDDPASNYALFKHFWETRVNSNSTAHIGDFTLSQQAMFNIYKYGVGCTGSTQGNWQLTGPNTTTNLSTDIPAQGLVRSIWVDPSDHDHIWAGSASGGLWEKKSGATT